MQTFLPYPDFKKSAQALDNKRLGKQRIECLQILRAINDPNYGWQNHPAVKMWRGYSARLVEYMYAILDEWSHRGFEDAIHEKIDDVINFNYLMSLGKTPDFIGYKKFHLSHQSNLIRKFPEHYRPIFGENIPDNLPYYWPV